MIPKPEKDHNKTKGWRPIDLINCIGKLGENVVTNRLQESGLLHRYQFRPVKGRSATEAALRVVMKSQSCMARGGAVGWELWDVKGDFQSVREEDVVVQLKESEEDKKWTPWYRQLFSAREFEMECDSRVGEGADQYWGTPIRITSLASTISYLDSTNNYQNGACLGD